MNRSALHILMMIIIIGVLVSCHPARDYSKLVDDEVGAFNSIFYADTAGHVYDVHIYIQKNQLSGLLFYKLVEGKYRFSIITKTGQKLIDVSILEDDMVVHHVMDQLNKTIILEQLKKDFQLLILHCEPRKDQVEVSEDLTLLNYRLSGCGDSSKEFYHFTYAKDSDLLSKLGVGKKNKLKRWVEFKNYHEDLPQHITIDHQALINLRLELYLLKLN